MQRAVAGRVATNSDHGLSGSLPDLAPGGRRLLRLFRSARGQMGHLDGRRQRARHAGRRADGNHPHHRPHLPGRAMPRRPVTDTAQSAAQRNIHGALQQLRNGFLRHLRPCNARLDVRLRGHSPPRLKLLNDNLIVLNQASGMLGIVPEEEYREAASRLCRAIKLSSTPMG